MDIPGTLQHKPVVCLNGYGSADGKYAPENNRSSDVEGLSLGLAQWSDRGQVDISAKVWRHTGERWSRQSEELPLHRTLDLALIIIKSLEKVSKMKEAPRFALREGALPLTIQDQPLTLERCDDNPELDGDVGIFNNELASESTTIHGRLKSLAEALHHLGY